MTLHFDLSMIIGLCMIPGGLVIGVLLVAALAPKLEIGAFAGMIPGIIIAVAGVAVFLVGLGMEIR